MGRTFSELFLVVKVAALSLCQLFLLARKAKVLLCITVLVDFISMSSPVIGSVDHGKLQRKFKRMRHLIGVTALHLHDVEKSTWGCTLGQKQEIDFQVASTCIQIIKTNKIPQTA